MTQVSTSTSNDQRSDDVVFSYLSKIEDFLLPDKKRSEVFNQYVKHFADLKCSYIPKSFTTITPISVHVNGFDCEQIYQQLQTINEERLKNLTAVLIKSKGKSKHFGDLLRETSPEVELEEEPLDKEEEEEEEISKKKEKKKKKSVRFFDEKALEKFLDEQDIQEMNGNGKISLDEDDEGSDEENDEELFLDDEIQNAKYDEFFDPPSDDEKTKNKKKKNKKEKREKKIVEEEEEEEEISDVEDESNLEGKSDFEKQQIRLKKQLKAIEKEMLSEKPWQLAGEVEAPKRPENSLLEVFLQYDRTTRLPPSITNETTTSIEDLIKQRIRDRTFDDVERKKRSIDNQDVAAYKKEIVLDHEKSQVSLAQVYEDEYLKKQSAVRTEKKDERHETIRKLMENLFVDLDALSNFRFTPRPPAPEVSVVNNLPAVVVEEIVPSTVNDATLLAPEEIHIRPKGDVKARTERTTTDKKHERRLLKKKRHLEEKSKKPLNEKEEKEDLLKKISKIKNVRVEKVDKKNRGEKTSRSSTKFFEKLQQAKEIEPKKKRAASSVSNVDPKRLKL